MALKILSFDSWHTSKLYQLGAQERHCRRRKAFSFSLVSVCSTGRFLQAFTVSSAPSSCISSSFSSIRFQQCLWLLQVPAPAVHTVLPQDMRLSAAKHHRLSEVNSPRKLFRVSAAALAFSQNSAPAGHVMLTRPLRDPRASADVGDAEESSSSRSPTTLRPRMG